MADLITADEARAQLRIDGSADDAWLALWIPIISQAIASWLKDSWRLYVPLLDVFGNPILDSSGDPIPDEDSSGPIINPAVRGAALVEIASQYRFREGDGDNAVPPDAGYGYVLCRTATALLSPIRKSTIA